MCLAAKCGIHKQCSEIIYLPNRGWLGTVHFVRGDIGSFRYFIVGNVVDGFVGIERDMSAEIATGEENLVWEYKIMDPKECKKEVVYRDRSI